MVKMRPAQAYQTHCFRVPCNDKYDGYSGVIGNIYPGQGSTAFVAYQARSILCTDLISTGKTGRRYIVDVIIITIGRLR